MAAMRKALMCGLVLAGFAAIALGHFEDGTGEALEGAVPEPGSTTTVGDENEDPGFDGPLPDSPAAEAAEAEAMAPEDAEADVMEAEGGDGGEGDEDGGDDSSGAAAAAAGAAAGAAAAGAAGAAAGAAGSDGDEVETTTTPTMTAVSTPEPGTADPSSSATMDPDATDEDEASADSSDEDDASGRADGDPTDEDDGSVCFPGSATVLLDSGRTKTMEELNVGDRVHVGRGQYSDVFMFTHKLADVNNKFVAIETVSGAALRLTSSHYLYVNGDLRAAKTIVIGDTVQLANGEFDAVRSVSSVVDTGLYNPQTVHGDVVVDGVLASTYTTTVEPAFAHAVLSPFRALYNALGFATTSLESGSPMDVVLPSGGATTVV